MNKIDIQLQKIKSQNRLGLMTHIVVGYPNLTISKKLIKTMVNVGIDFIELQIPFSDPMADGSTLMHANQIALDNKTKVKDAIVLMAECNYYFKIPFLFMTYFNIIFNYGIEKFCHDASRAGCSGLIVPDMPLDEEHYDNFIYYAEKYNLYIIRTLAPVSTPKRLQLNAKIAKGFVYFAGKQATTGVQEKLDNDLFFNLKRIKQYINAPIAVGFGISSPEHIKQLKNYADIAVVGSKVISILDEEGIKAVKFFLRQLVKIAH